MYNSIFKKKMMKTALKLALDPRCTMAIKMEEKGAILYVFCLIVPKKRIR